VTQWHHQFYELENGAESQLKNTSQKIKKD
jgi:hypothetical protein